MAPPFKLISGLKLICCWIPLLEIEVVRSAIGAQITGDPQIFRPCIKYELNRLCWVSNMNFTREGTILFDNF